MNLKLGRIGIIWLYQVTQLTKEGKTACTCCDNFDAFLKKYVFFFFLAHQSYLRFYYSSKAFCNITACLILSGRCLTFKKKLRISPASRDASYSHFLR